MKGKYNSLLFFSLFVVAIGILSPFFIGWRFNYLGYKSFQDFGPIGDWIGGSSTPIFTFATFIIVVAAFLVQREELRNTKDELALNRKEMELSRAEIEKQTENLTRQGFENTFFKMISLHNEIVGAMKVSKLHGKTLEGREVFSTIYESLVSRFDQTNPKSAHKERIVESYQSLFDGYESKLAHYFANLLAVLQIIHESKLFEEDKKMYAYILATQFSSHEIPLILYHCLSAKGHPLRIYIYQYNMITNINKKYLLHPDDLDLFIESCSRLRI